MDIVARREERRPAVPAVEVGRREGEERPEREAWDMVGKRVVIKTRKKSKIKELSIFLHDTDPEYPARYS